MKEKDHKKYSLLAEVACDYYERGLSQNEIAERIHLSRTRVSRLLKEAEKVGIVKISIDYTFERHFTLEERMKDRFQLREVQVLNGRIVARDAIRENVGKLAAKYIASTVKKDMVIGTGWGNALSDTVQNIDREPINVQIVQLMGAVICDASIHTSQGIVATMAERFGCKGDFLNLPLYIEDDYVRRQMCADHNNKKVLNEALVSDMVLTGVTHMDSIKEDANWLGYLSSDLWREAVKAGAVGALLGRFFDKDGKELDCQWNRRLVGMSLEDLKQIDNVVMIASGKEKVEAIDAILKSGCITTLITDGTTASALLGLDHLHG